MFFLFIIVNFSDIFSSLITNRNSLFIVDKIEVPSYDVYAVSIEDFSTFDEANIYASQVKEQGGAGLVYESGEKFVLLMGYPNLIEAKEIQSNFIELGYNSRIVNLEVSAISHKYNGNNSKTLKRSIEFFRELYKELTNSVLNFDKKVLQRNQLNSIIAKYIAKVSDLDNNISKLNEFFDADYISIICHKLNVVNGYLQDLVYCDYSDVLYSSFIKEISLKIVFENIDMNYQINCI